MSESKIEDKQDVYRIGQRRSKQLLQRKRTLFWLAIIVLFSFMISAFTDIIPFMIDQFYKYTDTSYRPMDKDRMIFEQEQQSSKGTQKRK
jgi:hypothetical protein